MKNVITKFSQFASLAILFLNSANAYSMDIKKVRQFPVRFVLQSHRAIFDVERCLIEKDMPSLPAVYRAPDRPNESMVVWDVGLGNPLVFELVGSETGTTISVKGGGKLGRSTAEGCV